MEGAWLGNVRCTIGSIYWRSPNLSPPCTVNADQSDDEAVPGLDAVAVGRWRALSRSESPWLHEEVASRMLPRLQWFRQAPDSWLHWQPGLGGLQAHRLLRERLPDARVFVWADPLGPVRDALAEPATGGWRLWGRRHAFSVMRLPEGEQVGMLWANMWLHHEPRPQALLRQWHSLLRTDGFLMFSCLGPDSLRELRTVYARQGWSLPGHAFTDMHDWGDMLVQGGFAEPVMDMERLSLSYSSAMAVLDELRGLGRNFRVDRPPGLRGRAWRSRLLQALEEGLPRDAEGRLLLTFELVYGHAYKPQPRVKGTTEQAVSVDDMRAMLRAGRR